MTTEYRAIPGFPGYRAGEDGTVWSCLKIVGSRWHGDTRMEPCGDWKLLKPAKRKEDGRARLTLRHESGALVRRYRSYFILLAFAGPRPVGLEACHEDGNCLNDSKDNLRWDTPTANKADMKRHGTQLSGDKCPVTKIPDSEIPKILSRSNDLLRVIAKDYNVSLACISAIRKGKSRKC